MHESVKSLVRERAGNRAKTDGLRTIPGMRGAAGPSHTGSRWAPFLLCRRVETIGGNAIQPLHLGLLSRIIHQPEKSTESGDSVVQMPPKQLSPRLMMLLKPACQAGLAPSPSVEWARLSARHPVSSLGPTSAALNLSRLAPPNRPHRAG